MTNSTALQYCPLERFPAGSFCAGLETALNLPTDLLNNVWHQLSQLHESVSNTELYQKAWEAVPQIESVTWRLGLTWAVGNLFANAALVGTTRPPYAFYPAYLGEFIAGNPLLSKINKFFNVCMQIGTFRLTFPLTVLVKIPKIIKFMSNNPLILGLGIGYTGADLAYHQFCLEDSFNDYMNKKLKALDPILNSIGEQQEQGLPERVEALKDSIPALKNATIIKTPRARGL